MQTKLFWPRVNFRLKCLSCKFDLRVRLTTDGGKGTDPDGLGQRRFGSPLLEPTICSETELSMQVSGFHSHHILLELDMAANMVFVVFVYHLCIHITTWLDGKTA